MSAGLQPEPDDRAGAASREPDRLLEREAEIGELADLMDGALRGDGRVVVLEGPAGIGKTALLEKACERAAAAGMAVLTARGAELEVDFGHGIVRQLFEPMLRQASSVERGALRAGAAALAAPAIDLTGGGIMSVGGPPADLLSVLHGLYWLTANAAEERPLLLAVDDLQWSDTPSLRYLLYLARRLEGLQAFVVVAVRPGEPGAELALISQMATAPGARVIRPAALSEAAIGVLVKTRLQGDADARFVSACHDATGGVPFLVHELLRALAAAGVTSTTQAAVHVSELGPRTVAHATLLRLSPLGAAAIAVAQAVGVLGRHADVRRVAALADLTYEQASVAADVLADVHVLRPGRPLEFVHPIVRAAVYGELAPGARSSAHAGAAAMLVDEAADVAEIATHLLLTEPGGAPGLIETMREAAAASISRGAAESAIAYLRRALGEATTAPVRVVLLNELGRAEAVVRDPRTVADLQEALRLAPEPTMRARIAHDLAEILVFSGQWEAAVDLIGAALADLDGSDEELTMRLEAMRAAVAGYDPRFVGEFDRRCSQLRTMAARPGPAGRALSLLLASITANRMDDPEAVLALVERGLDGGKLLAEEGAATWSLPQAAWALILIEELDQAARLSQDMLDDAHRRGSVLGATMGLLLRGYASVQRGALRPAEADLRASFGLASEYELVFALPSLLWFGLDVFLERPGLEDIVAVAETLQLEASLLATVTGALLLDARGRLRLLRGDKQAGIEDLRMCGQICEPLHFDNPMGWTWRSTIALHVDDHDEALRLVAEQLSLARATGLPRAQGVALRAAGLVEGGEAGIELLRESVTLLERSPAALELARAYVELGGALRRRNRRAAARDPLRAGLDLARRCGADRLAARAHQELKASGARPRRLMITGRDALTPSEQRVAQMAADGRSNRHVAQELFVTTKTVENQLSSVYRKLGVSGRGELASALTAQPADA